MSPIANRTAAITRTDRSITDVEAAIEQTRDEIASPTIPLPLKVFLAQRIDSLQQIIDHHRNLHGRR